MNFLKELISLFKYLFKIPSQHKQIIFYAEHEGYYSYFEGLIKQLTDVHCQRIFYITSDPCDPVLRQKNPLIQAVYLKNLLPFVMGMVQCKVFVMTLTDLNNFYLKRSINSVHYLYVFHSLVSTHMMYTEKAFDHYDSLLCVGPYQITEIQKREQQAGLKTKSLVPGGYYRLERIYTAYQEFIKTPTAPSAKPLVLVAPSWGVHNVLESCGQQLVQLLLKQNYRVIVRPHPETMRRNPALIRDLESQFRDQPDFFLEKSVSTDESLLKADILICDCSGVALEYAFGTERPVLFFDVPYKIQNPNFKELGMEPFELSLRSQIGVIVSPDNTAGIMQSIERLRAQKQSYQERIRQLREKNIFAFGRSSEVGAQHVMRLL